MVGTRADGSEANSNSFETEDALDVFEKINTLRVIIVREDNTVEHNRLIRLPDLEGVLTLSELEFAVSTDRGEKIQEGDGNYRYTEKKRIYLIANEASIVPSMTATFDALTPPPFASTDEEDPSGAVLTPSEAASWLIYKEWATGAGAEEAEPYINNDTQRAQDKKFIPMTEFFDVEVSSRPADGGEQKTTIKNLFLTRNLVKFQFGFMPNQTEAFKIKSIRFDKLMEKEYLFPNNTVYSPDKTVAAEKREIIKFTSPGSDTDNQLRKYTFKPANFGTSPTDFLNNSFGGDEDLKSKIEREINGWNVAYEPLLYFCESNNNVGFNGRPIYDVNIIVEIYQKDGSTIEEEFQAQRVTNLPYSLPRNTIVRLNFGLSDRSTLDCEVDVLPYTGVWLFPSFGIERD